MCVCVCVCVRARSLPTASMFAKNNQVLPRCFRDGDEMERQGSRAQKTVGDQVENADWKCNILIHNG